jgi:hypothetical protein
VPARQCRLVRSRRRVLVLPRFLLSIPCGDLSPSLFARLTLLTPPSVVSSVTVAATVVPWRRSAAAVVAPAAALLATVTCEVPVATAFVALTCDKGTFVTTRVVTGRQNQGQVWSVVIISTWS